MFKILNRNHKQQNLSTDSISSSCLSSHQSDTDSQLNENQLIKMNQDLNDLIKTLNKKAPKNTLDLSKLDDDAGEDDNSSPPPLQTAARPLDSYSSTQDFKKYLDDLKSKYLEKLTFSCPSKQQQQAAKTSDRTAIAHYSASKPIKNQSRSGLGSAKRSLNYETKQKEEQDLILAGIGESNPELTKSQILSRLVQIREYLKQAYSMLATLQTSNDLINYSQQMNKLHSLIDHLKDQEKGYMDLLDSFIKYQQMSMGNLNIEDEENGAKKDSLELSNLVEGSFISDNTLTLMKSNLNNEDEERTENDEDEEIEDKGGDEDEREDLLNTIGKDLNMLEQLKEQKKLLRSIRMRKEELKALEGRRKALEALQKVAVEKNNTLSDEKLEDEDEIRAFFEEILLKTSQSDTSKLNRKTFKQEEVVEESEKSLAADDDDDNDEPSSQIEKSKQTIQHYEELIKKNTLIASSLNDENEEENITVNVDDEERKKELKSKLTDLAESEKKLA
jgi:hypothetical protein